MADGHLPCQKEAEYPTVIPQLSTAKGWISAVG